MAAAKQQRRGGGRQRRQEQKDEFDQAVIDLARVTRVMAGGKRMRFRACVAVGDKKGRIGIGVAKGADVSLAIGKATNVAKKHLVKVTMTPEGTISHEVRIKKYSAQLFLRPAPVGTGIIAGSVLRQIFQLAGLRDVVGKIMGTGNKVNNAKATVEALALLKEPMVRETTKRIVSAQKETSDEKASAKQDSQKSAPKKKSSEKAS